MEHIEILTTNTQIAELAELLAAETVIAVDLEADSMHNYQEKVCLIQVSTTERTVLIDPLAATDLSPLRPVLADPAIRKIFHAADYDLRSLKRDFDIEINGLFDTMICAQLLGEPRLGLADLLRKYFGVELDKRFQKADWSQRPLPAEMVRYAAADTSHLHRLVDILEPRLKELKRQSWADEEFLLMEKVCFAPAAGPICLRLKGAGNLERRELGILEALMQWREKEGCRRNSPVYKVLGNKSLLALAQRAPESAQGLRGIDDLSSRQIERYGQALLQAVREGLEVPEPELPRFERQPRRVKDPAAEARLKTLKSWRQKKADSLSLDPGVLINNALLEAVSRNNPRAIKDFAEIDGLKNWQRKELGQNLLDALGNL